MIDFGQSSSIAEMANDGNRSQGQGGEERVKGEGEKVNDDYGYKK